MFFPTVRGRIRLDFDPAGATCVVYGWRAELGFLGTWAGVNYGILSSDPNWHSLVDTWIHPLARDPDPDFVIGPDGYPKVVYGNSEGANQQLFYATCDPYNPGPNGFDFWPREVVHEDEVFDTRCFSPSLRFDGLGRPTIASYLLDGANAGDSSIVWIVRNGLGSWELSPITGDVGRGADHHPDLCLHYRFGHDDNPGISYRGDTVGGIAPLMYAWLDPNDANDTNPDEPDGVWQFSEVDGRAVLGECDKGLYNSLATDPNGMPALAYYDQTWNCLRYAVVAGTPDTYTLATFNEGAGHGGWGTIEREPNLPRYAEGSYVTLTATPSEGKEFLGWVIYDPRYPDDRNYAVEDTNNPTQFLIEYDTRVGAAFACAGEDEVFLLMVAITAVALGIATTRSRNRHG
ncbi:MAG: hypothetical protein JXQ73_25620 [Phycisphaerae bacterium]|nr:hypothetical protein [Phycisphaerae bacterium]